MTSPTSDEEWAAAFLKELTWRAQLLIDTRGAVVGGGRRLLIHDVMILEWWPFGAQRGMRLAVQWWDGQRMNTVIDSQQPGVLDSLLAGSIVLPLLREAMVLDDLAAI